MGKNTTNDMTQGNCMRLLVQFFLPILAGNVFQQLYSAVDTIIVGRTLGSDALASVGSIGSLQFFVFGFCSGLAGGVTVVTSQFIGAGKTENARRSTAVIYMIWAVVSLLCTVVGIVCLPGLLHILNMPEENVEKLSRSILDARQNIHYCKECLTLTDDELCPICKNPQRDHSVIMVVEDTRDLAAYEKTGKYEGVYHVLHGAISPMLGIGPNDIKLKELIHRLEGDVREVIIATNSSLEGETTAMYISKLVKPTGIKVSRIASGVPVGGDLEYIDEVTLLRALEGRVEL